MAKGKKRERCHLWLGQKGLRAAVLVFVGTMLLPFVMTLLYTVVNPPASALMMWRYLGGQAITRNWVSFDEIALIVPLAVIASEDARFCSHRGVDWDAVQTAIDDASRGRARGASTISMQTMKNLFLWPSRSYVRKAIEVPLALFADLVWSKRRMIEIYLNIAEWGPGIFGIHAAARHHFKKTPDALTRREAARLAASLPNPFERTAGKPGPQTRRIARVIERRMAGTRPHVRCLEGG